MGGLGFTCSQCNNHLLGLWNSQWQVDVTGDFYGTLLFYFITRKGFYFPLLPHHPHKVFTRNESWSRGGWVCSVCLLKGSAAKVCMILSLIRRRKRIKKRTRHFRAFRRCKTKLSLWTYCPTNCSMKKTGLDISLDKFMLLETCLTFLPFSSEQRSFSFWMMRDVNIYF